MNSSDEQLVYGYLKGDEKALEILFSRYAKPIYSFVYRYVGGGAEVEYIAQRVFINTWRSL